MSPLEKKGYLYFKEFGYIPCHNGINMERNSFQQIGSIIPYKEKLDYDRYHLTKDIGVYKVPTLRNITLIAPYFHNGSAKTLKEAVNKMSYHNLGFKLPTNAQEAIITFFHTLTGKKPRILRQ